MQEFMNFARIEVASICNPWAQDEGPGEPGSVPGSVPGSAALPCTDTVPHFSSGPFPVPQFPHLQIWISKLLCVIFKERSKPKKKGVEGMERQILPILVSPYFG